MFLANSFPIDLIQRGYELWCLLGKHGDKIKSWVNTWVKVLIFTPIYINTHKWQHKEMFLHVEHRTHCCNIWQSKTEFGLMCYLLYASNAESAKLPHTIAFGCYRRPAQRQTPAAKTKRSDSSHAINTGRRYDRDISVLPTHAHLQQIRTLLAKAKNIYLL